MALTPVEGIKLWGKRLRGGAEHTRGTQTSRHLWFLLQTDAPEKQTVVLEVTLLRSSLLILSSNTHACAPWRHVNHATTLIKCAYRGHRGLQLPPLGCSPFIYFTAFNLKGILSNHHILYHQSSKKQIWLTPNHFYNNTIITILVWPPGIVPVINNLPGCALLPVEEWWCFRWLSAPPAQAICAFIMFDRTTFILFPGLFVRLMPISRGSERWSAGNGDSPDQCVIYQDLSFQVPWNQVQHVWRCWDLQKDLEHKRAMETFYGKQRKEAMERLREQFERLMHW